MAKLSSGLGSMTSLGGIPGTSPFAGSDSGTDPNGGQSSDGPTLASLQAQLNALTERVDKLDGGGEDDTDDGGGDSIANNSPTGE